MKGKGSKKPKKVVAVQVKVGTAKPDYGKMLASAMTQGAAMGKKKK